MTENAALAAGAGINEWRKTDEEVELALSADVRRRWMTASTYVEVKLDDAGFRATLDFRAETGGMYH